MLSCAGGWGRFVCILSISCGCGWAAWHEGAPEKSKKLAKIAAAAGALQAYQGDTPLHKKGLHCRLNAAPTPTPVLTPTPTFVPTPSVTTTSLFSGPPLFAAPLPIRPPFVAPSGAPPSVPGRAPVGAAHQGAAVGAPGSARGVPGTVLRPGGAPTWEGAASGGTVGAGRPAPLLSGGAWPTGGVPAAVGAGASVEGPTFGTPAAEKSVASLGPALGKISLNGSVGPAVSTGTGGSSGTIVHGAQGRCFAAGADVKVPAVAGVQGNSAAWVPGGQVAPFLRPNPTPSFPALFLPPGSCPPGAWPSPQSVPVVTEAVAAATNGGGAPGEGTAGNGAAASAPEVTESEGQSLGQPTCGAGQKGVENPSERYIYFT